jgi:hypothetical protein
VAWFAGAAAIGCLVLGLVHLWRLFTGPAAERAGETSAAAAAIGMAAMFSPIGDPVPLPVWIALYTVCAGWTAVLVVRRRADDAPHGGPVHHLLCSAAMVFMLVGHGGHGAELGLLSVMALVGAGYFAWHGLRCADTYRLAPGGPPRTVAGAHLAGAVTMSGMLVAMI